MADILLEVKNLKTYFSLNEGLVKAVDGADLTLHHQEVLGLVGESGCGKSMTARSILNIVPHPGKIVEGSIIYYQPTTGNAIDLAQVKPKGREIRRIRGAEIAMIFQEPMTSFSPVHSIGNQIVEAIRLHTDLTSRQARTHAIETLHTVGMPRPHQIIDYYPHQLSGGMRQRAMIAMALVCNPRLLIADEPTTALDVTTQAQILELLHDLQAQFGMAIIFITHDLGVIAQMADRVAVMYLGRVVEETDVETLFHDPKHPYTRALLRSIPRLGKHRLQRRLDTIQGSIPDPYSIPPGCPFSSRCEDFMRGVCDIEVPAAIRIDEGHMVRCVQYTAEFEHSATVREG